MKRTTPADVQKVFESIPTPFHIGFFGVLMLLSAICALYGMFAAMNTGALQNLKIDKNILMMLLGWGVFVFSFPTMICLLAAHLLLARIRELERKVG